MSEIINNREIRLQQLKSLIRRINDKSTSEEVKAELSSLLKAIPYDEVVAVEQELFEEGELQDNMLELCDLHSSALKGLLDLTNARKEPSGHPVQTFKKENQAIRREISFLKRLFDEVNKLNETADCSELFLKIHTHFNNLMDVDKHYRRKEYHLFPFLEKYQISGPSKVMWGKHDQTREFLKNAVTVLNSSHEIKAADATAVIEFSLLPAVNSVEEMIYKEEHILFPMSLDTLNENDWYEIYNQADEIGYCLYSPTDEWKPEGINVSESVPKEFSKIKFPTGALSVNELNSMLNTLPFDMTFVDKDDYVRYFTEGPERIFQRGKAVLGRKVQFCHPPSSVNIVDKILDDFKTDKQQKASFWINMREKFIYISYYAVRNENKEYLGTLEVTQDLTELRLLEGERRILSYE